MSQPSQPPNLPDTKPAAEGSAPQSRLQTLLRLLRQVGAIVWALVPVVLDVLKQLGQIGLKLLGWINQRWLAILPKLRTRLPEPWNTKLPDAVFTAVAIGVLVLLLWIPTALGRKPAVAVLPPGSDSGAPVQVIKPDRNAERVAAIQEKLADVGTEYGGALVEGVRADFADSRLTVTLSDDWTTLTPSQQTQLANDLLKRSKKLSFEKFEIANLEGKIIARPAVVGSGMVVLLNS